MWHKKAHFQINSGNHWSTPHFLPSDAPFSFRYCYLSQFMSCSRYSVFVDITSAKWTLTLRWNSRPKTTQRHRRHSSMVSRRCTCECRCRPRRFRSRASAPSTTAASPSSSRSPASSSNCRRRRPPSSADRQHPFPTSTSRSAAHAATCSSPSPSLRNCAHSQVSGDRTTTTTSPCCHSASLRRRVRFLVCPGYRTSDLKIRRIKGCVLLILRPYYGSIWSNAIDRIHQNWLHWQKAWKNAKIHQFVFMKAWCANHAEDMSSSVERHIILSSYNIIIHRVLVYLFYVHVYVETLLFVGIFMLK